MQKTQLKITRTSSSRNNDAFGLVVAEKEEEEEEEEEDVIVGSIDGPHATLGCVIYCFLVKSTMKKTDYRPNGPTDRPWTHLETTSSSKHSFFVVTFSYQLSKYGSL